MAPLARRIQFLRCLPPAEQVGVGCQLGDSVGFEPWFVFR